MATAAETETALQSRKRSIVSALCIALSLDPGEFFGALGNDVKTLTTGILKAAGKSADEFVKWLTFAGNFPYDSGACFRALNELNDELAQKSVLVGGGMTPSEADIIVFATIHSFVIGIADSERIEVPHLVRWIDYIQTVHPFGELFERILLEKAPFDPPVNNSVKDGAKVELYSSTKKAVQSAKDANNSEAESKTKTTADMVSGNTEAATEKKLPEKVADEKDKDITVSLLKIQVGLIRKTSKHPSADSLLVEEIDVGESKCRQVVSGLAKFCSPEALMNRLVVLITNVKAGKLRDVVSEGLVLCASNDDHTVVEPLIVPEGAKIGECVSFSECQGKPEAVLNPKKKQLEKITPHLYTDDKGVATFKGVPFMTSAGPCTSSISHASIK